MTQAGRTIIFQECDDIVGPKIEVNLRTEPSTAQGNDTISCHVYYNDHFHRTGYDPDSGWSRVEYDGKVLYVSTPLIYVIEEQQEE